ncbi:hypothetical protein [Streptomyces liliifuscus]|uniref:Uncharacterized protein n=1 Tax=Streptomyces liliifuscus TaxID=2797636 RepID=A0A7T7L204_9ACTN|nr:hypothetical protein [Streptomyces liliifuscus]QQM44987.1 hypothetical protein JEQ17_40020 [Streptomyces liliifuscus]
MTTPPRGHRDVIEAALDDWWLHTDPCEPFHAPAVAEQVETYLLSSGYVIAPDTRKTAMPRRRDIATLIVLTLACALTAVLAVIVNSWVWGCIGAAGALLLAHQAVTDIRDRRRARNPR